jgi:hypothetical protein
MHRKQQGSHERNCFRSWHVLQKRSQNEVQEQSYCRVQQQIEQVIAQGVHIPEQPIQGKAGESDRAKDVATPCGFEESFDGWIGHRWIVKDIWKVIVREAVEQ